MPPPDTPDLNALPSYGPIVASVDGGMRPTAVREYTK